MSNLFICFIISWLLGSFQNNCLKFFKTDSSVFIDVNFVINLFYFVLFKSGGYLFYIFCKTSDVQISHFILVYFVKNFNEIWFMGSNYFSEFFD